MKTTIVLILFFLSDSAFAQWPGFFYTFELKDNNGKFIDTSNENYRITTVMPDTSEDVILGIRICEDNKTWRFYVGGYYKDLGKTRKLKIEKLNDPGEVDIMIIEFPSTLSGGKEKYYRNLYAGEIKYIKGTYRIKLPKSGG
ncbi:MAG: hypothetical protein ACRDFC_07580, partial [Ignavibacteria bacterium]